ncbi:uncharacterized protein ColSpa_09189 [Colletotrichum spaethianum]|uniref:Uncharacterized protein n=1 Tax=Colletotrichum spaethianum TaxID=700344 RepID=A0AA37URZ5_9PEZI|nr:uncharacterized protein ColSpa_09189 [Colletotrichum spaethianum]GKT49008.1 hypothetical protein ColSpa_09189 [Colletotrichum spaethianum]
MSASFGAVAEEQSQGRATQGRTGSEIISLNTSPAIQPPQASQSPIARSGPDNGMPFVGSLKGHRVSGGHRSESVSESTPAGGNRSFDSLPYVRTNRLPPMQLKSAPSALRSASSKATIASASKRKRDSSFESMSQSSSSDDIDEDEIEASRMSENSAVYSGVQTTATASAISQRSNEGFDIHSDVSQTQRQWNGPNMFRTRTALSPIVLSSSDDEDEENGTTSNRNMWQMNLFNGQSHHSILSADGQYLRDANRPSITGGVDQPPKKLTCEERRLQLCAAFDSAKFDAMIYGQAEATSPPEGVLLPSALIKKMTNVQSSGEARGQLYMKIDPRIHWPHNRSDQWYKRKMDEIKARGGRKANFGKAAQRMRQQRLEEERRDEQEKLAIEQGLPAPTSKPPQPWSHHRPMDFGDVPEEELPAYVRKNPEWLQATAWMRENREQSLLKNKEAAALRAAGLPWDHLFSRSGP